MPSPVTGRQCDLNCQGRGVCKCSNGTLKVRGLSWLWLVPHPFRMSRVPHTYWVTCLLLHMAGVPRLPVVGIGRLQCPLLPAVLPGKPQCVSPESAWLWRLLSPGPSWKLTANHVLCVCSYCTCLFLGGCSCPCMCAHVYVYSDVFTLLVCLALTSCVLCYVPVEWSEWKHLKTQENHTEILYQKPVSCGVREHWCTCLTPC